MNKRSPLVLLFGFLIVLSACEEEAKDEPKEEIKDEPKPPTIQEVANTLFGAFKANDFATLQNHYGSAEELQTLITSLDATTDPEGSWAARRQGGLEKLISEPKHSWDKLQADAKVSGVDISQIGLEDIRIEKSKKGTIELADIRLVLKSPKGFFRVKLDDCMKTSQGWRLFNAYEWQRPPPEPAPFYPGARKAVKKRTKK